MFIGEKLPIINISKEKKILFNKDIIRYLKNEKILYFKSSIISNINQYNLIHKSLLKVNPDLDINKIRFQLLDFSPCNIGKIDNLEKINNLLLIFESFKNNIICIYRQIINKTFINKFVLLLNYNELYYIVKQNKFNKNKNIFYKVEYPYEDFKENEINIIEIRNLLVICPFQYNDFEDIKKIDLVKKNLKQIEIFKFDYFN